MVTIKKGTGKSTTYGGDGRMLLESTSEGKSGNVIRGGDGKVLYEDKDKDKK